MKKPITKTTEQKSVNRKQMKGKHYRKTTNKKPIKNEK